MGKIKIRSGNLGWIIYEKLQEFDDFPQWGIPIAIVPAAVGGWRVLIERNFRSRRPLWAKRIETIEKQLQDAYKLVD